MHDKPTLRPILAESAWSSLDKYSRLKREINGLTSYISQIIFDWEKLNSISLTIEDQFFYFLSFSVEFFQDNCIAYKNLLQELAQKEGFCLPTYGTNSCVVPHMPVFVSTVFVSTVEVKGETFQDEGARTKKQAEMNAAKVAYIIIKERKWFFLCLLVYSQLILCIKMSGFNIYILPCN